tara:strand:+ start:899 stop:1360 length:462 start_codon:yes stop_codon:yes gene_type:complete
MEPMSIVLGITSALKAGRNLASLSKEIGNFFDSADTAKKNHSRKMQKSFTSVNQEALSTFADKLAYDEAEASLKKYIDESLGPSYWTELLKIRKEILVEKREQEARERLAAQARQEMTLTVVSILLLLLGAFVGAGWYLQHLGYIDVKDHLKW